MLGETYSYLISILADTRFAISQIQRVPSTALHPSRSIPPCKLYISISNDHRTAVLWNLGWKVGQ